jgi:hypothetical protein
MTTAYKKVMVFSVWYVQRCYMWEVLLGRVQLRKDELLEWHTEVQSGLNLIEKVVIMSDLAKNCCD